MMQTKVTFLLFALPFLAVSFYGQDTFQAPATYDGVIPCADCPGIRTTVTLFKNGMFILRRTYFKNVYSPNSSYDLGSWSVDGNTLVLKSRTGAPQKFAIKGVDKLTMLDINGNEIQSKLNFTLSRSATVDALEDTMPIRGMYSYMADAATLTECSTGKKLPLVASMDGARIEAEYAKVRQQPEEPVLVSMLGHFSKTRNQDSGLKEAITMDMFEKFLPGATCSAQRAEAVGGGSGSGSALEGTTWQVEKLLGNPVTLPPGSRSPHLAFADGHVSGSTGCNRIAGAYTVNGNKLQFGRLASTKMACLDNNAMQFERDFEGELGKVDGYRMSGTTLELLAGDSAVVTLIKGK
jgi:copper homeostasis protein (lipoprotein)